MLTNYTIFGVSIIAIHQDTHTLIDDTPEIELIELIPHLLSCLVCTEFYLIAYFFNTYLHLSYLCTVFLFFSECWLCIVYTVYYVNGSLAY